MLPDGARLLTRGCRLLQAPSACYAQSAGPFAERCGEMNTVLTTANVAERKRFQFWQDAVCDTFVELDCQAGVEGAFFGEITTAHCEGLHFSTVRSDSQIVKRTRT